MISDKFPFEYAFVAVAASLLFLLLWNLAFLIRRLLRRRRAKRAQKHEAFPEMSSAKEKLSEPEQPSVVKARGKAMRIVLMPFVALGKMFAQFGRMLRAIRNGLASLGRKLANLYLKMRTWLLAKLPFMRRPLRWTRDYWFIWLQIPVIIAIGLLVSDMWRNPWFSTRYPDNGVLYDQAEGHIYALFDRPLHEEVIDPYLFPEIPGEWKLEPVYDWLPFFKRKLTFYPQENILPDSRVFVYYAGIRNQLQGKGEGWEQGVETFAVPAPEVVSVEPVTEALDFGVDRPLTFTLDHKVDAYTSFELVITPAVAHTYAFDGEKLLITFDTYLAQSTKYTYELKRFFIRQNIKTGEELERVEPVIIYTGNFTTIKEPLIESITPSGSGVLVNTTIDVVFDQNMKVESVVDKLTLDPAFDKTLEWSEDDRKLVIRPAKSLSKETKYTLKFAPGMLSKKGGVTEKEVVHEFTTIGKVVVNSFSPGNNASNVKRPTNITVNFNQAVDHASAQSKFSISPAVDGAFSWSGNSMIFNPNADLGYQTTYTISVAAGVQTVHGLDSTQGFSSKFTTEVQYFKLNVPVYYQNQRFSCNIDAARMALAYRGVYVSTGSVHGALPKDSTPYDPAGPTWGNPYTAYVGDINGNPKGYGVYWNPISNYIRNYRSTSVRTGWDRTSLLTEVGNGNPVIIWAHNGYSSSSNGPVGSNISWHTPGGTSIYAIAGMHSYVVVGWNGPIDNPSSIILNDTNRGTWTVSTSYFNGLWSYFNNTGIVVY